MLQNASELPFSPSPHFISFFSFIFCLILFRLHCSHIHMYIKKPSEEKKKKKKNWTHRPAESPWPPLLLAFASYPLFIPRRQRLCVFFFFLPLFPSTPTNSLAPYILGQSHSPPLVRPLLRSFRRDRACISLQTLTSPPLFPPPHAITVSSTLSCFSRFLSLFYFQSANPTTRLFYFPPRHSGV